MEKISTINTLFYTRNFRLHYTRYPTVIEEHGDANWISGGWLGLALARARVMGLDQVGVLVCVYIFVK